MTSANDCMTADSVVADLVNMKIYNFVTDKNAQEVLERANAQKTESINTWTRHIKNYPDAGYEKYLESEQRTVWQIMKYGDFKTAERKRMIDGEPQEITKERFEEMLDILPPLYWCTHSNVEMFCVREMYSGTYTSQYAYNLVTGKYYTKMVDAADRSTWISELL